MIGSYFASCIKCLHAKEITGPFGWLKRKGKKISMGRKGNVLKIPKLFGSREEWKYITFNFV